jgi:branched-chain amino acid transport system ATP-binding protein
MANALELRGVSAGYGDTVVLEDINLALASGENVSIIGRNGVGKSTLLATVMGHTRLHSGDVLLGGQSVVRMPIYARALAGLGYVPQEREILSFRCARTSTSERGPAIGPRRACSICSTRCRSG